LIVVIEGPSAAGKTSWIAAHSEDALVVAEYAGPAQVDADEIDTANYWAEANAVRWATAIQAEPCTQIVLCDTDPFKLHYTWSLWRLGHASTREWNLARDANRRMFTAGRLGIADVVLVSIPDSDALARRRASDSNRTRRNFELHKQLSEPLRVVRRNKPTGPAARLLVIPGCRTERHNTARNPEPSQRHRGFRQLDDTSAEQMTLLLIAENRRP